MAVALVHRAVGELATTARHELDRLIGDRIVHIVPSDGHLTGIASWRLGTPSTYVVLSAADIATLYASVNSFGSAGSLAASVWINSAGNERTLVAQNNKAATVAQLELRQGGNSVLLSQANCADLASTLNAIGVT
jgi:hypothetical protein